MDQREIHGSPLPWTDPRGIEAGLKKYFTGNVFRIKQTGGPGANNLLAQPRSAHLMPSQYNPYFPAKQNRKKYDLKKAFFVMVHEEYFVSLFFGFHLAGGPQKWCQFSQTQGWISVGTLVISAPSKSRSVGKDWPKNKKYFASHPTVQSVRQRDRQTDRHHSLSFNM